MSAHDHGHHDHGHHDHGHHDHGHHDHGHHDHGSGVVARVRHALTPHSHDAAGAIQEAQTSEETSRAGIRAAWIGLTGMGITAALQIVIVAVSGSVGLLADTLHNVGHAVTTIPLIIAFRLGRRRPTAGYPYGYRRAEDLVGLLIAGVIALSAALVLWESARAFVSPPELTGLGWVFAAGIVGALGNELVAIYRIRIGRRIGSAALIAEGQHARADGLSSVAVALGIVGVWLGFPRADALVGLGIGLMILLILISSLRVTLRRLMDGLEPGTLERVEDVAATVTGVRSVHEVRARWVGHRLEADLTVGADPTLDLAVVDALAERLETTLRRDVAHLERAVVRIRPHAVVAD